MKKILRFKPYFRRNKGGVTFSGGEPLLQPEFLIEMCKLLKRHKIHIALDTAGVGVGRYEEILKNVDLVIFDIKHVDSYGYLYRLNNFIKHHIVRSNIEKIEFLPYHTLAKSKYKELGIEYPLGNLEAMDKEKCQELYERFMKIYNKKD